LAPPPAEGADAGTWAAPAPQVFRFKGAPAEFKLTDAHLLFVDGAAFIDWTPSSSLKLKSLPRGNQTIAVGPMFAFQRLGTAATFSRLEAGKPATLAAQKGAVQLFAVTTNPKAAKPPHSPAKVELSGKLLLLGPSAIQFLAEDRRVTVDGLAARKSYLLTLTPQGDQTPVLVLGQGDPGGRPPNVGGMSAAAVLPSGEHLISNVRALHLVLPSAFGLKRSAVEVKLAPADAPSGPGKPKKAAAAGAPAIVSTVAEARPHFEKATAAIAAGQTAEARAALGKGLKADPRNAAGHYWAGVLAQRQADIPGALFQFQIFLKVAPANHPSRDEVEGLVAGLEKAR
jgi:hypothetical protein